MILVPLVLAALAALPPAPADEENPLGPKTVKVQGASFNKVPSTTRGFIREAKIDEKVEVIAVDGNYAKVKLSDGTEAFISRAALVASDKYVKAPSNEKEMMEMKGQGYEAGRFDPQTEAEYKKQKGPEMDKAYKNVDALEARQAWVLQRGLVSQRLDKHRKEGNLAEYSSVK